MATKMYCDCCGKESKELKFLYARAANPSNSMYNLFAGFVPLTGQKEFCNDCIVKFENLMKAEIEKNEKV